MLENVFIINMRNILFMHLIILYLIPESTALVRREIREIGRALRNYLILKIPKTADVKRERFWKIDLTKFEP